ncbi:MAG TPA: ATP-binding protein [Anaerolineae bacterium]|nr:ATP-binding protein [Anaerolineae bacterium]
MFHLPLLALVTLLTALALFVWNARPDSPVNRWFAAFSLFVASWVFGIAGLQGGTHLDAWARFTFASATFIPASFLAFMRTYPTPSEWPSPLILRATLVVGAAIALLSLATPLMVHDTALTPAGLSRKTGGLYPVFSVYFLATWAAAIGVFISKWRHSRGIPRAQLQYLGAGIILSGLGATSANLLIPSMTGRSTYSWVGPYFSLLLVTMVGHAIIRHRLMDLRLFINRGLAYALTIALASGAVIATAGLLFPAWDAQAVPVHPYALIIGLMILTLLTSPAQRLFTRVVDPYLFRGRIDYTAALRSATRSLGKLMQPAELSTELRQLLTEAFVPESFVMLVREFDSGDLERLTPDSPISLDITAIAPLLTAQLSPSVFVMNPSGVSEPLHVAEDALRKTGVEVVVSLVRRGQLLGAILLGPRRSGDAYFANDLVFIESLAELASIALENALLYRQRIQMFEYSERLLESLDSAVVAIDVSGRITSFNPAARHLLGLNATNRGALLEILPPDVGWALSFAISDAWHPRELEFTIDHRSRGLIHAILSTAVLHDDQHRVTGALAVVTDLSTIKALERNQRRVEHLAIMARFYAGIAHEIRNPLAAISNFISMLPDRFDDPEYRDTAVRLLPMEVNRIVRLADRLRLMAPSEGGKLAAVALPPLLNDIVAIHSPAAHDQRVKISLQCPEELHRILGDPSQLVQLFVNLLRNAIEAMPDGGTVTIEADQIRGGGVVVRVIDEGAGIEPTVRNKIFEPFFTTKPAGTGLGLSICREIADFHRARLNLFPRADLGGTVAELEFPSISRESGTA